MQNSYAYDNKCYFFSTQLQKFSWFQADKFCKSLPLNSSLLVIENESQFEFIRRKLVDLKEKESPVDQLLFLSGFFKIRGQWLFILLFEKPRKKSLMFRYMELDIWLCTTRFNQAAFRRSQQYFRRMWSYCIK